MTEIISVSMEKETAEEIDGLVKKGHYGSRSEAVRLALRSFLMEQKQLKKLSGMVDAVVLFSYPQSQEAETGRIKHRYMGIVRFQTHNHFGDRCLESFTLSGKASEIVSFYGELQHCRKISYCRMIVF